MLTSDKVFGNVGPKRCIVLTTFGSLGDLHPYIALALGLQARGHEAVIATSGFYREKVEALGIGFWAVRPDIPDWQANPELMRKIMDLRKGPEHVVRDIMLPVLGESYADLLAAVDGANLLVSHPLTFATRLVAEKKGIPWVSSLLQPMGFFSVYDPPVLAPGPMLSKLRFLGPAFYGPLFRMVKRTVRSWAEPVHQLRVEVGLPAASDDPLIEGQHSPALVLALFSQQLAAPQPDWPKQTVVTGFPFYDMHGDEGMPKDLARFLDEGAPPIVFTLGSSAVMDAGQFYEFSAEAAQKLGCRAVLLIGKDPRNRLGPLPEGIAAFDYAPFSELFPRAAVIVHQGGIGTTGQAMRSGKPMLVMPYSHDQPDNAERVTRLGIARTLSRRRYNPARAAAELKELLNNPSYAARAREVGRLVSQEDGVATACQALEAVLQSDVR